MTDLHILTECYIDTLLAEVLSPPKKGYNHQHSCTKVLKTMKEKLSNNVALGVIDDDKVKLKELENFHLLKQHNVHLAIYKHSERPHYIVKISKAAEDFILKNAQKCDISMLDYNLPDNLPDLAKQTKSIVTKNNPDLKRLFSTLKQNKNSDFHKLAQWIEFFKKNPYDLIL
jgi:hypothetical protein